MGNLSTFIKHGEGTSYVSVLGNDEYIMTEELRLLQYNILSS